MVGSTTGIKIQQQKFASQCRDTTRSMSIWREVFCGNYQILNFSFLFSESRTSDHRSRFTVHTQITFHIASWAVERLLAIYRS